MARSRNIKPGFFHNEDLVDLPFEYRLLFIGLWCMADREGRLENRPKKIKMQVFPADDLDMPRAILGLSNANLITLYTIDNIEYISIDNFLKHQHPHHKESKSVIPPPSTEASPVKASADPSDSLLPITDPLKESVKQKFTDADLQNAKVMFSLIQIMNPNHKPPNMESWANQIRLIRERDGRSNHEIVDLFTWANNHHFWKSNILSPKTLREKWDRLTIQRQQKPAPGRTNFDDAHENLRQQAEGTDNKGIE